MIGDIDLHPDLVDGLGQFHAPIEVGVATSYFNGYLAQRSPLLRVLRGIGIYRKPDGGFNYLITKPGEESVCD